MGLIFGWGLRGLAFPVVPQLPTPCACTCQCLTAEPVAGNWVIVGVAVIGLVLGSLILVIVWLQVQSKNQFLDKKGFKGGKGTFGLAGRALPLTQ